jgi:hypothetical protein
MVGLFLLAEPVVFELERRWVRPLTRTDIDIKYFKALNVREVVGNSESL